MFFPSVLSISSVWGPAAVGGACVDFLSWIHYRPCPFCWVVATIFPIAVHAWKPFGRSTSIALEYVLTKVTHEENSFTEVCGLGNVSMAAVTGISNVRLGGFGCGSRGRCSCGCCRGGKGSYDYIRSTANLKHFRTASSCSRISHRNMILLRQIWLCSLSAMKFWHHMHIWTWQHLWNSPWEFLWTNQRPD